MEKSYHNGNFSTNQAKDNYDSLDRSSISISGLDRSKSRRKKIFQ